MRIALVHRDLHAVTRGGIGTLYRALAPRLRAAGCEVTLITQHSPRPLELQGTRVITLPRTEDMERHRQAVTEALASLAPDIAEASSWEAETLHYARLPPGARAPVVVRGDLSAVTMRAGLPLVTAERELVHAADAVLAVSGFAAADLASAYAIPRPVVTANGADRDRFRPGPVTEPAGGHRITLAPDATAATSEPLPGGALPPPWTDPGRGRKRLIWVGKTTPMKGWDRLERITRDLAGTAHVTVLLGHAPALSRITLTGTEDNVTILQDLPERDMPGFYRAADWLLSTSRWEGFGLAIAEALACGTPALLPAGLGTAPELLAAGGGRTYRDADDLRAILNASRPTAGTLPPRSTGTPRPPPPCAPTRRCAREGRRRSRCASSSSAPSTRAAACRPTSTPSRPGWTTTASRPAGPGPPRSPTTRPGRSSGPRTAWPAPPAPWPARPTRMGAYVTENLNYLSH